MKPNSVYATRGGRRYHADENCRALHAGQELFGGWGTLRTHHIDETSPITALGEGKDPCTVCIPGLLAAIHRSGSECDFGHEPVEVWGEPCCARCRDRGIDEDGDPWSHPTIWPCTSAIILGLVERAEVAA